MVENQCFLMFQSDCLMVGSPTFSSPFPLLWSSRDDRGPDALPLATVVKSVEGFPELSSALSATMTGKPIPGTTCSFQRLFCPVLLRPDGLSRLLCLVRICKESLWKYPMGGSCDTAPFWRRGTFCPQFSAHSNVCRRVTLPIYHMMRSLVSSLR